MLSEEKKIRLISELKYETSRSSGPGGQHVNKTESRVMLRFNVPESGVLTLREKAVLKQLLVKQLNEEGFWIMWSQDTRSQVRNKEIVTHRFLERLEHLLRPRKKRINTRPSRNSVEKRLERKKRLSDQKKLRRKMGGY